MGNLIDYIIENRDEILDIFERYGADDVEVIGSVSRKEEKKESDIDFVANLKKLEDGQPDLEEHAKLRRELIEYFNREIDLADYEQIQSCYPNALKKGIKINRALNNINK